MVSIRNLDLHISTVSQLLSLTLGWDVGGGQGASRLSVHLSIYNLQSNGIHFGAADPQEDTVLRRGTELQRDVHVRSHFVAFSDWNTQGRHSVSDGACLMHKGTGSERPGAGLAGWLCFWAPDEGQET